MDGAQGAEPAAGHSPQRDGQENRQARQGHGQMPHPGRENGRERDQGIEVKEGLDRLPDVVLAGVVALGEQVHEQAEEPGLGNHAQDLKGPVFSRPFFFQRGVSPVRIFPGRAVGRAAGRAIPEV